MTTKKEKAEIKALLAQVGAGISDEQLQALQVTVVKGQQLFTEDFGINTYTLALKSYFEGEFAVPIVDGVPAKDDIVEIIEIVGSGKDVSVRFDLHGTTLRMSADKFARSFSVLAGFAERVSNPKLAKTVDLLTRAYYLGEWVSENGLLDDDGVCSGCGQCHASVGESGVIPESPDAGAVESETVEKLLGLGAVAETESEKVQHVDARLQPPEALIGLLEQIARLNK